MAVGDCTVPTTHNLLVELMGVHGFITLHDNATQQAMQHSQKECRDHCTHHRVQLDVTLADDTHGGQQSWPPPPPRAAGAAFP